MNQLSMNDLSGAQFEHLVQKLVSAMGFEIETCSSGPDGGIDILASSSAPLVSGRYVIQCKRYAAKVGVGPVRDLYGVVMAEGANKGILITNSAFSKMAEEFARGKPLQLMDGAELEALLDQHGLLAAEAGSHTRVGAIHRALLRSAEELRRAVKERQDELALGVLPVPDSVSWKTVRDWLDLHIRHLEKWFGLETLLHKQVGAFFSPVGSDTDPRRIKRGFELLSATLDDLLRLQLLYEGIRVPDYTDVCDCDDRESLPSKLRDLLDKVVDALLAVREKTREVHEATLRLVTDICDAILSTAGNIELGETSTSPVSRISIVSSSDDRLRDVCLAIESVNMAYGKLKDALD